jgi:O-antigen/teichoic acid export membrane protein
VLQFVSPETDHYTASVFTLLILAFIPYTAMYIFGSLLTAKGELKALIIICATALLVNLLMNVWLIPVLGAWGAAITALITQAVVGFGKMSYTALRVHESVNLKLVLYIIIHVAVSIAAAQFMNQSRVSMLVSIFILLIWTSLFTLVMKIYKPSVLLAELRGLVKM